MQYFHANYQQKFESVNKRHVMYNGCYVGFQECLYHS